jgi:hypothetical protein
MGTWGAGILDGDAPLDFLGGLAERVLADVVETLQRPPGEEGLGTVTGGVGLLLQLAPHAFTRRGADVAAAIRHQAPLLPALPEEARRVLALVAEGRMEGLTARDGSRTGPLLEALGGYVDHQGEPSLYVHAAARRYVEHFVERCASALDAGLGAGPDAGPDTGVGRAAQGLQQAAAPLGALGALLIVRPGSVPPERVERWAHALQRAEAESRAHAGPAELRLLEDVAHNLRLALRLAAFPTATPHLGSPAVRPAAARAD